MDIQINIPDLVLGTTVIKRKASLFTMIYNLMHKTVSLSWTVTHFANNNGEYGESLENIISNYSRETVANNNTKVNPETGAILPDDTLEGYVGEYDFFNGMAEAMPIQVHDLIRSYGSNVTDWSKK